MASAKSHNSYKRKGRRRAGKFAMVTRSEWNSEAYRYGLDSIDYGVLVHAIMKENPTKVDGLEFPLTYEELSYLGGTHRISASLKRLVKCGFLDVVHQGGMRKEMSIYKLSDRWRHWQPQDNGHQRKKRHPKIKPVTLSPNQITHKEKSNE